MSTPPDLPPISAELDVTDPADVKSSLSTDSAARFSADASSVVLGIASGVISARWLGPAGKGIFASLTFLSNLFRQFAIMGLGDAAIILVRNRSVRLQRSLSVTTTLIALFSTVGAVGLFVWGIQQFGDGSNAVGSSVLLAAISLPIVTYASLLTNYLLAMQRVVASSALLALTGIATTVAMFIFLAILGLGLPGAMLAGLIGALIALIPTVWLIQREGLSFRPGWDGGYSKRALKLGSVIQVSMLLRVASGRLDLLLVFSLLGAGQAGFYSIGLTIFGLVGLIPGSLTNAAFPRLAGATSSDSVELTERLGRFCSATSVTVALFLVPLTPFLIPVLFGEPFRPAIGPSLLLLPGGILWSNQIWVTRALTARNRPRAVLGSFAISLVVMLILDVALIPHLALTGAATAADISACAGAVIGIWEFHRAFPGRPLLGAVIPGKQDFLTLLAIPRLLRAGLKGR
jgi:O-antigen/teichoic acid export membrane protein